MSCFGRCSEGKQTSNLMTKWLYTVIDAYMAMVIPHFQGMWANSNRKSLSSSNDLKPRETDATARNAMILNIESLKE